MIYPSALFHRHPEPQALAELLVSLGFQAVTDAGLGTVLENGSLQLRLLAGAAAAPLTLEAKVRDPLAEAARLQTAEGWTAGTLESPAPDWQQLRLCHSLGLELTLLHHLDEDELETLPPLPSSLEWDVEATLQLQQLLRSVPLDFRDAARRRATERAEYLTVANGGLRTDSRSALQGLVDVTPAFQHPALAEAIRDLGHDPEPLFAARTPA